MLKLPPPIWALIYVLAAVVISWFFDWSKLPGLPLAPLGILLVAISWILPVWAIVLFRREGTEVEPTSPTNRKLITSGPYQFTRNPMYWASLFLRLASQSGSACGQCLVRLWPCSLLPIGSTFPLKRQKCGVSSERHMTTTSRGCAAGYDVNCCGA